MGGVLSGDDKVLELVGTIYDAALNGKLWPNVLKSIGDAVGGPKIVFGIDDPANGLVNMHAPRPARTVEEFDGAFSTMTRERMGGFLAVASPLSFSQRAPRKLHPNLAKRGTHRISRSAYVSNKRRHFGANTAR